jgi:hypothetical protein
MIITIINDRLLLQKLKNATRESVSAFLDVNRLTSEYENIYKKIIEDKRKK